MCKIEDLADSLCSLNDEDMDIWSRPCRENALRLAVSIIYSARSENFSKRETVTLKPGCYQDFPDCHRILGVVEVNGKSCDHIEQKQDTGSLGFLEDLFDGCPAGDSDSQGKEAQAYKAGYWKPDTNNEAGGWLKNPVPDSGTTKAVINCVPKLDLDGELPYEMCTDFIGPLIDIALARLYLVDHKSGHQRGIAQDHWGMAMTVLGLKLNMDFALTQSNYVHGNRVSNV